MAGHTYTLRWTIAATGPVATACELATVSDVIVTFNQSTSVTPPSNQIICTGSYTAPVFSGGLAGTVYSWINNNTAIGLATSGTGNLPTFTATNSGSTPIVGTITVTPEYDNAGIICYGTAQAFTITVNPTPAVVSAGSKTICNINSVNYNIVSSVGSSAFTWTAAILTAPTGGTITGFSDCAAACGTNIGQTLTNTGTSTGVVRYIITPIGPAPSNCPGTPFNFDVTVNPSPDVSALDNTICSGSPAGITLNTTVTGTTFYYAAPTISGAPGNISGGVARLTPGSSAAISDVLVNVTGSDQTATYTVFPTKDGCVGTPATIIVTVRPEPVITAGLVQSLCADGFFNATASRSLTTSNSIAGTTFT